MLLKLYLFSIILFSDGFFLRIFGLSGIAFGFAWLIIYVFFINQISNINKLITFKHTRPLILFVLVSILSTIFAANKFSYEWLFTLITCALYFHIGTTLFDRNNIDKLLITIVLSSIPPAIFAFFQSYTGYLPPYPVPDTIDYVSDRLRPPAGFMDSNYFAFQMCVAGFCSIYLYVKNKKKELIVASVVIIFADLLTFSRTYMVTIILVLLYAIYIFRNKKNVLISLILTSSIAILSIIYSFIEMIKYKLQNASEIMSGVSRIAQFEHGINILKNNFLLGVGGGNFINKYNVDNSPNFVTEIIDKYFLPKGLSYKKLDELIPPNTMHNVPLKILFELGVLGLISFLVFIVAVTKTKGELKMQENVFRKVLLIAAFVFAMFLPIDTFIFLWITLIIIASINQEFCHNHKEIRYDIN